MSKVAQETVSGAIWRRVSRLLGLGQQKGRSQSRYPLLCEFVEGIVTAPHLDEQHARVSAKMPVAKAIRYLLTHWDGLCVFLDDGRVEIDNNTVERRHRVVASVRRNSLFAGSDAGARTWAVFTSLIQTANLNGVDPVAWLTDVLERMASGDVKANDLDRLLPWNWKAERAVNPT